MRNLFQALFVIILGLSAAACSSNAGNMAQMNQMKDSIFAQYPDIAAVTLNVENDNDLLIAIGSQDLYAADEGQRQKVADEMAAMAVRIFGKDNKLNHGKIIVTANETNQDPSPSDGLVSNMDFAALKDAHE